MEIETVGDADAEADVEIPAEHQVQRGSAAEGDAEIESRDGQIDAGELESRQHVTQVEAELQRIGVERVVGHAHAVRRAAVGADELDQDVVHVDDIHRIAVVVLEQAQSRGPEEVEERLLKQAIETDRIVFVVSRQDRIEVGQQGGAERLDEVAGRVHDPGELIADERQRDVGHLVDEPRLQLLEDGVQPSGQQAGVLDDREQRATPRE